MEAAVPVHVWTIEDVVGLLDLEPGRHKMKVRLRYESREAAKQPSVPSIQALDPSSHFTSSADHGTRPLPTGNRRLLRSFASTRPLCHVTKSDRSKSLQQLGWQDWGEACTAKKLSRSPWRIEQQRRLKDSSLRDNSTPIPPYCRRRLDEPTPAGGY